MRLRLVGQRLRYAALPAVGTDDLGPLGKIQAQLQISLRSAHAGGAVPVGVILAVVPFVPVGHMPAAQKGGALFQGDAAGLLRKRKIEPGRRAVPIHRFARRQQDMRAAHVELCPDIASERLPVVRPASDKPVLPDGAVVIKKIEHAQARLCRRRDHRRMHGAADGKLRLVRTHCNGERAGIFPGRFIRGSLCTEIKRKPCSVRRFRFRQRLQRVKDLEGGFARDEFPAAFVVGRRHQRGRGVFVYAYREQTVQPHRRPAAAVPAEHGGKRSGEYAAQKLGAVVAAARQMQADAGQRAVRGIGIQPFGIAENGKMHVPTPPAVVLPAQWPGYKL